MFYVFVFLTFQWWTGFITPTKRIEMKNVPIVIERLPQNRVCTSTGSCSIATHNCSPVTYVERNLDSWVTCKLICTAIQKTGHTSVKHATRSINLQKLLTDIDVLILKLTTKSCRHVLILIDGWIYIMKSLC